jgi:hypothetical protein
MRKLPGIIAILLFIGVQANAQKEVLFKMQYLPKHNYSSTMKMDMNMEMNVSGDSSMVKQMKSSGQPSQMLMQMQSGTKMDVTTSVVSPGGDIPLIMNVTTLSAKMKMNGKETDVPMPSTFQKMYGKFTREGKMSLDSVAGMKANDSVKVAMKKMIKNIQGNIDFPNKTMKVGDTFVQTIPMDIPLLGSNAKIIGKTTYKLTGIQDNKAYFDINMVMTMDMTGKGMTMDVTGGGDGKMVFDTISGYPTTIQNNMKMIYSFAMPQVKSMKMDGKMNMLMDMQTAITAN